MARKKANRYRSKQQVKWAFATGQPFARKWAHRNIRDSGRPFTKKLPKKVRRRKKK